MSRLTDGVPLYRRGGKRIFDVLASSALIALTAPVQVALAAGVAVTMGRPVVYRQLRPGRDEKMFSIMKFRTMREVRPGEDASDGARLTRFGAFLRRTSLDELPELYNVIRGDMSLVGPRPLLERYLPFYRERERVRHSVRPGITGYAQVSGRNTLRWDERLAADVWYVENYSLVVDLQILLRTVTKVVFGSGVVTDATTSMLDLDAERAVP